MSTHRNCPHCETVEPIRDLIVHVEPLGSFEEFQAFMLNNIAQAFEIPIHMLIHDPIPEKPTDPRVHLAPNHQDYTTNHRKQHRRKFKRGER